MSTVLSPAMKRSALISLLRDPTMWPEGFRWNYQRCSTCAIGLLCSMRLILESPQTANLQLYSREEGAIAKALGISPEQAVSIFWRQGNNYDPFTGADPNVTASMVADALEKLHNSLAEVSD